MLRLVLKLVPMLVLVLVLIYTRARSRIHIHTHIPTRARKHEHTHTIRPHAQFSRDPCYLGVEKSCLGRCALVTATRF